MLIFSSFRNKLNSTFIVWIIVLVAHFYHPVDDSLPEKVKAYKEVFKAWQNMEASFRFHDQQGWEDRLGSKEELRSAKSVIQHTLDKAMGSFSIEEISLLTDKNLITPDELELLESQRNPIKNSKESIIEERKNEISDSRAKHLKSREQNNGYDLE